MAADHGPDDKGDVVLKRLAENLRRFREKATMSLHGLSSTSSVDRKVLRGLESAKLNPSIRTLQRVADAFHISLAVLLGAPADTDTGLLDVQTVIALNVKRLRHKRKWSAADVESRIRMKAAYVSFIETGKRGCTLQTLARLAEGFEVDVVDLILPPPRRHADVGNDPPSLE